jgi:hypothetical protein
MKSEMSAFTRELASAIVPLKATEERAAIKAAQAHVVAELSDHYRILGGELRIEKPSAGGKVERRVGVVILDYGNRRTLDVLVDPKGNVVRVDRPSGQPAFTAEEITEARGIAEQDGRVARLAKTKRSFVSEFGPERTSDNARRIGLRYAVVEKGGAARVLGRAIVDMSTRQLVQFEENPPER